MIHSRPFSHDPRTGITETFHFDDLTEQVTIETTQVSHVDDLNTAQFNETSDYGPTRWKGDWHHVARIPLVILEQLRQKGILDDPKAFRKWLNDPDNRAFRAMPGRL